MRYGPSVEDMGGVKIESQCATNDHSMNLLLTLRGFTETGSHTKKFLEYFMEELKDQFRRGPSSKN